MKFVHCADVHLDSPLRGLEAYEGAPVEEMRGATRTAFENVVDLCIDEEADLLLIAGDLFDRDWPDFNTGLFLVRSLARLREAGVRVCIVYGNHDAVGAITKTLPWPENTVIFRASRPKTLVLEEIGVAIHGQSFATPSVTENLAAGFPNAISGLVNIGLLHTSLDGREGHEPYAPCTVTDLTRLGYAYWALGHVHTFETVMTDPHVVFPGCTQGRHARETGPKGCVVVEATDGEVLSVERRITDVARWEIIEVDVSEAATLDDVRAKLASVLREVIADAEGRLAAVRVGIVGEGAAIEAASRRGAAWEQDVRALGIEIGGGGLWIEKVRMTRRTPMALDVSDEALGDLAAVLDALREDPGQLLSFEKITSLAQRLPAQVFDEGGEGGPADRAWLEERLIEASDLALARLTGED
jgi:DNA repair protein SbcD/Mre11